MSEDVPIGERSWLPRLSLALTAVAFGGFGAVLLVFPQLLGAVGVVIARPAGAVELRAFYGGLELGLAAFFAASVPRPAWWRPALLVQILALGGAAAGRLAGVVVGGGGDALLYALLGAEATGAAVGLIALKRL